MQLKPPDILEHLTPALMAILKQVPGVGMAIEYKERLNAARQLQGIFNQIDDMAQRMAALEGLATIPAAEVERIASRELHGSAEQNAYVLDVVQHITRQVTRKINSTRRLGAPRLQDDENFYLDLIPTQRPHDYRGQAVPQHPRWILQELIGSGGFGEVWRAQHETLPEQEAIKFCHEESQREFLQREVNTLKLVHEKLAQHPNIVRLKDVNLTQAPYWLAFEYIAGGTLLDVMQQRHLAWSETLHLMTGIVQGVAAAHALGIVHRDLKPANILLTPDGVPKVTDFGLGKVMQPTATTTNLRMGTENYASPEQRQGLRADPADDVYALGVMLWQMLTGQLKPLSYEREINKLSIPDMIKDVIRDSVFKPLDESIANATELLQRLQDSQQQIEQEQQEAERRRKQQEEARLQQKKEQERQEAERRRKQQEEARLQQQKKQEQQELARRQKQELKALQAPARKRTTIELIVYLGQTLALLVVGIGVLAICSLFAPDAVSKLIYMAIIGAIIGAIAGEIAGAITLKIGVLIGRAIGDVITLTIVAAIGGAIVGAIVGALGWAIVLTIGVAFVALILMDNKNEFTIDNTIVFAIFLAITLAIVEAIFWYIGNITLSNATIALLFVYTPFLIGGLLIILPLIIILDEYNSNFFIDPEQIEWVYALYAILTQYWYIWMFAKQFAEVLLPMPILITMTTIVLGSYLVRLIWRYNELVNKYVNEH